MDATRTKRSLHTVTPMAALKKDAEDKDYIEK